MQIFQNFDSTTFKLNGTKHVKNFVIIKQGDTNIAVHSAYDTRYQLLGSTHFSQVSVGGVVYDSQTELIDVLCTIIFVKQVNEVSVDDLDLKENKAEKGVQNGYASLDFNAKVPLSEINDALLGNVSYQGLYNASTNTPNLTVVGTKGHYYINTVSATAFGLDFVAGDWIISDGTNWSKVDNTDAVTSVNGMTGNITISNPVSQTITNGVTTTSPSEDVIYDALALKQNVITNPVTGTGTANTLPKFTGTGTIGNSSVTDTGSLVTVTNPTTLIGLSTLKGTVASDGGQLGAELLTTGAGTNWAGSSFTAGYTHTAGSTTALTSVFSPTSAQYYQVTWVVTNRTAGGISFSMGGYTSIAPASTSGNIGILTTSTTAFSAIPTTDFDGTITFSVKVVSNSLATTNIVTSTGSVAAEIRADASPNGGNTYFGVNVGKRTTTGSSNTGYGNGNLINALSSINNTAIGRLCLNGVTSSSYNTAVGYNVFQTPKFDNGNSYNVGLGGNIGGASTTGIQNILIGWTVGSNLTSASANIGIGYGSLANTTGTNNVVVGTSALSTSNTVSDSVNIGGLTSQFQTSGGNNVAIGGQAGRLINNKVTALTVANTSTFIGWRASPSGDSQTNQIVIGYDAIGLGSNTTVLGNASTVTSAIYGNLLLGTTTDDTVNKLQVNGSLLLPTTGYLRFGGNTSSFPAIGKLATGNHLGAFCADGSNYVSFGALSMATAGDMTVGSGGVFGFLNLPTSRLQGGSVDAGFSRITGSTIGVGNGTLGNTSGTIIASTFKKVGGTSSQFLKADGSVDTNTYLTTDIYTTGGTYSNGTAIFTNNTGGTFSVTGFNTGSSDTTRVLKAIVNIGSSSTNNITTYTILKNTAYAGTAVWTRSGTGVYVLTLSGEFSGTLWTPGLIAATNNPDANRFINIIKFSNNEVYLRCLNAAGANIDLLPNTDYAISLELY